MVFTVHKVRLYRKTAVSDTFAGLAATEKLEFNVSQDESVANGWTTMINIPGSRGIGDTPAPGEDLAENQDTGADEFLIIVRGTISRADDATNAFKINLNSFRDGAQEELVLPAGKFSLELDRDPHENIISIATLGLKVKSLEWILDEEIPNMEDFILKLEKAIA